MFQPASLKGPPSITPIDERFRKKYLIIYVIIIILSFIPVSLFEYFYYITFWKIEFYWLFFLLLPLNLILLIYILQWSAIFFSLLFLTVIKLLHGPKEGVFKRDVHDKDYFFWNLRNIIKKWPLYITASNPFPWLKNRFTLRFFGTRIGSHCLCNNSWISSELVSIGKNVIIGMGSTILNFGIEQDKFILKKIVVEDDVIIGAKCVLLPGTIIRKGVKLSVLSFTNYNQVLEKNSIYIGQPAKLKMD